MPLDFPPFHVRPAWRPPFRSAVRPPFGSAVNPIADALVNIDFDNAVGVASISSIPNIGLGGSNYDLDTIVGTAANLKPHPSGSCLFYGVSGDGVGTPDSAAVSITSDIDLRVKVALDDYSPATEQALITKWSISGGNRSYFFRLEASGALRLFLSGDGSTNVNATSSAAVSVANGETIWLRVFWDQSESDCFFFTSTDGISWNPLGTTQTLVLASIFDGNADLEIGSAEATTSNNSSGSFFKGEVYDGTTLVADFNPVDAGNTGATSFPSSTTGETWTLNGNTFIQNTAHKAGHFLQGVGIENAVGQLVSGQNVVFVVARYIDPGAGTCTLVDSKSNLTARLLTTVDNTTNQPAVNAGSTITIASALDAEWHVWVIQNNQDATSSLEVNDIGSITGDMGSQNWDALSLGVNASGANFWNGPVRQVLQFAGPLSAARISQITNFLIADNNA